jgi:hypothetical protein
VMPLDMEVLGGVSRDALVRSQSQCTIVVLEYSTTDGRCQWLRIQDGQEFNGEKANGNEMSHGLTESQIFAFEGTSESPIL